MSFKYSNGTAFKENTIKFIKETLPKFFSNNFSITSTKKSRIAGLITGSVLILLVIIFSYQFSSSDLSGKWFILAFCLLFPVVIGFAISLSIKIKNDLFNKIWHFILLFLMPFLSIAMTEALNSIFIYDMTYLGFFGNYMVVILLYFLIFAISGSFRLSILISNPIMYGLALAHSYVVEFRGTPFIPMDFLSITTAKNVANTYDYTPTPVVFAGTFLFIFIMIIGSKLKTPVYTKMTKIISRVTMGTFFSVLISLFYFTSIFANAGVKPDFWNQSRGYKNYGFTFSFFCNTKYLYMSVPKGYYANDVGEFVKKNVDENSFPVTEGSPNIICIMNESLSDLHVLGDFETNEDYMPFMHSLTENTVKGNLYVPVIGAGTSNTEFEFLTGHTTAFLPSGSNAYMLYIKNPIASLVSTLRSQGYSSLSFHPYYASGWNRISVYENMGFSSFKSLENLIDISIMDEYVSNGSDPDYLQQLISKNYPEKSNMLIRQYISDSYDYSELIRDYEQRDKSVPFFLFNVTMQNHGGYTASAGNFNECITINSEEYYNKATKYLSLVKASDNAFKGLIEYFSKVKEPTVICMFGDHQPSIETDFIAKLLGKNDLSDLTLEQEQQRHITPFYIWANYDIEEKQIDKLSSNYLSSLVLKTAGVKLTDYNKYLLNLSEKLPVIDTVGYIDAENKYYRWIDKSEYTKLLSEYEKIQYNAVFDPEHMDTSVFFINGFTPADIIQKKEEE